MAAQKKQNQVKRESMAGQLLIHPKTFAVAAEVVKNAYGEESVMVYDGRMIQGLKANGITVPKGFVDDVKKHRIFPTDRADWFAKAFLQEYYPHGLMQADFYWVNKADYIGPEGEYQKALDRVKSAFQNTTSAQASRAGGGSAQ